MGNAGSNAVSLGEKSTHKVSAGHHSSRSSTLSQTPSSSSPALLSQQQQRQRKRRLKDYQERQQQWLEQCFYRSKGHDEMTADHFCDSVLPEIFPGFPRVLSERLFELLIDLPRHNSLPVTSGLLRANISSKDHADKKGQLHHVTAVQFLRGASIILTGSNDALYSVLANVYAECTTSLLERGHRGTALNNSVAKGALLYRTLSDYLLRINRSLNDNATSGIKRNNKCSLEVGDEVWVPLEGEIQKLIQLKESALRHWAQKPESRITKVITNASRSSVKGDAVIVEGKATVASPSPSTYHLLGTSLDVEMHEEENQPHNEQHMETESTERWTGQRALEIDKLAVTDTACLSAPTMPNISDDFLLIPASMFISWARSNSKHLLCFWLFALRERLDQLFRQDVYRHARGQEDFDLLVRASSSDDELAMSLLARDDALLDHNTEKKNYREDRHHEAYRQQQTEQQWRPHFVSYEDQVTRLGSNVDEPICPGEADEVLFHFVDEMLEDQEVSDQSGRNVDQWRSAIKCPTHVITETKHSKTTYGAMGRITSSRESINNSISFLPPSTLSRVSSSYAATRSDLHHLWANKSSSLWHTVFSSATDLNELYHAVRKTESALLKRRKSNGSSSSPSFFSPSRLSSSLLSSASESSASRRLGSEIEPGDQAAAAKAMSGDLDESSAAAFASQLSKTIERPILFRVMFHLSRVFKKLKPPTIRHFAMALATFCSPNMDYMFELCFHLLDIASHGRLSLSDVRGLLLNLMPNYALAMKAAASVPSIVAMPRLPIRERRSKQNVGHVGGRRLTSPLCQPTSASYRRSAQVSPTDSAGLLPLFSPGSESLGPMAESSNSSLSSPSAALSELTSNGSLRQNTNDRVRRPQQNDYPEQILRSIANRLLVSLKQTITETGSEVNYSTQETRGRPENITEKDYEISVSLSNFKRWLKEEALVYEYWKQMQLLCIYDLAQSRPQFPPLEFAIVKYLLWTDFLPSRPGTPGTRWYILSAQWWDAWVKFAKEAPSSFASDSSEAEKIATALALLRPASLAAAKAGKTSDRAASIASDAKRAAFDEPGPIDNTNLLRRHSCKTKADEANQYGDDYGSLRKNLHLGYDFVMVNARVWLTLNSWYGGGPGICRTVIDTGDGRVELEMYPLTVTFHLLLPRKSGLGENEGELSPQSHEEVLSRTMTAQNLYRRAVLWVRSLSELGTLPLSPRSGNVGNLESSKGRERRGSLGGSRLYPIFLWHSPIGDGSDWASLEEEVEDMTSSAPGRVVTVGSLQFTDGHHILIDCRWHPLVSPSLSGNLDTYTSPTEARAARAEISVIGETTEDTYDLPPYPEIDVTRALSALSVKPTTARGSTSTTPGVVVVGLENLGNTCYMNSALQCLIHSPFLSEYFLSGEYLFDINQSNPLGTGGELAVIYGDLLGEISARLSRDNVHSAHHYPHLSSASISASMASRQQHQRSEQYGRRRSSFALSSISSTGTRNLTVSLARLAPRNLRECIAKHHEQFSDLQQQDAQEFLSVLLNTLSEDLNRLEKKVYRELPDSNRRSDITVAEEWWQTHLSSREASVIAALFTGQFKSLLTCSCCGYESARFEPFTILQLPLQIPAFELPGRADQTQCGEEVKQVSAVNEQKTSPVRIIRTVVRVTVFQPNNRELPLKIVIKLCHKWEKVKVGDVVRLTAGRIQELHCSAQPADTELETSRIAERCSLSEATQDDFLPVIVLPPTSTSRSSVSKTLPIVHFVPLDLNLRDYSFAVSDLGLTSNFRNAPEDGKSLKSLDMLLYRLSPVSYSPIWMQTRSEPQISPNFFSETSTDEDEDDLDNSENVTEAPSGTDPAAGQTLLNPTSKFHPPQAEEMTKARRQFCYAVEDIVLAPYDVVPPPSVGNGREQASVHARLVPAVVMETSNYMGEVPTTDQTDKSTDCQTMNLWFNPSGTELEGVLLPRFVSRVPMSLACPLLTPPPSVTLTLLSRRLCLEPFYFVHPFHLEIFAAPLILRVTPLHLPAAKLYELVRVCIQRWLLPEANTFLDSVDNITLSEATVAPPVEEVRNGVELTADMLVGGDDVEILRGTSEKLSHRGARTEEQIQREEALFNKWGFRICRVDVTGKRCSRCSWLTGCLGCVVPDNDAQIPLLKEEVLSIDWGKGLMNRFSTKAVDAILELDDPSTADEFAEVPSSRELHIQDCMSTFIAEEKVTAYCSSCTKRNDGGYTEAPQTLRLQPWRLPPLLVIQLKRFRLSSHSEEDRQVNDEAEQELDVGAGKGIGPTSTTNLKIDTMVHFPLSGFDLKDYLARERHLDPETSVAGRHSEENSLTSIITSEAPNGHANASFEESSSNNPTETVLPTSVTPPSPPPSSHTASDLSETTPVIPSATIETTESTLHPGMHCRVLAETGMPLDLASREDTLYDLYGVVLHSGRLGAGHFTAYVLISPPTSIPLATATGAEKGLSGNPPTISIQDGRDETVKHKKDDPSQEQWMCFDDDKCFPIDASEVESASSAAYLLFYVRRDLKHASIADLYPRHPNVLHKNPADPSRILAEAAARFRNSHPNRPHAGSVSSSQPMGSSGGRSGVRKSKSSRDSDFENKNCSLM